MFDSTKVSPLSPTVVQVQVNPRTTLPELDPLRRNLAGQTSEAQSGTSDVAQGINAALENFGTDHPDAAKIILIFTDVKFASANTTMPVTNLTALNVKVFVYKIPLINDDKLFIGSSDPFGNQLCPIGGSFEVISKFSGLSNPLLALNAFFTSTAALHAKVTNNSADYSPICPGYEQIDGNITTVSMPVFRADKTLIRVVGMDININNLGSLTDSVQAAILARIVGKGFKTSHFMLTRADKLRCYQPSHAPRVWPTFRTVVSARGRIRPAKSQTWHVVNHVSRVATMVTTKSFFWVSIVEFTSGLVTRRSQKQKGMSRAIRGLHSLSSTKPSI